MSKSIRIRTTPNGDDKYIKVELKQDFDLLEILSLKIKQSDVYGNFCSGYGVVAGRVIINNGFGVPNVKVSIFIPRDSDDSLLEKLYPYTSPTPDQKNINGIRYNLLPDTQQTFDHTPVGTFPTKMSILDDKTNLELYEKYYKFTTTTNEAGDFILFGVPTGNQILHYDMDVSDIGFISARPFELVEQGYSKELFESPFKFKSSTNLDSLTQIVSQNIPVLVQPFWCDSLSTGRVIGITREDISIDSMELIPTAMFFGSVFSDDEKDSINKNCRPRKKLGKMSEVITSSGNIEAIYRTIDGDIDKYEVGQDVIDDNGNWAIQLPMNLRKVVTDEFGNLIPSPDGIKGIATEADFRFRISMDATSEDKRLRQRAKFLVPNLTGNYNFDIYDAPELTSDYPFKINEQLSTLTQNTPYSADTTNQYNYLEEFYTFRWKKVYTIKQFIGRYQSVKSDESRAFTGVKDILSGEAVNKFPTNRIDVNVNFLYTIICILLSFFAQIVGIINGILNIINGLVTAICNFKIPFGLCSTSYKGPRLKLKFKTWKGDGGSGWNSDGDKKGDYSDVLDPDTISGGDVEVSLGLNASCNDLEELLEDYPAETWQNMAPNESPNAIETSPGVNIPGRFPENFCGGSTNCSCPNGMPSSGKYCYNYGGCQPGGASVGSTGCRRWQLDNGDMEGACNAVKKGTNQTIKDNCDGLKLLGRCWQLKNKCLFAGGLCKKCDDICDSTAPKHSCCPPSYAEGCPSNDAVCGGTGDCCSKCCGKIPLIKLRCPEELNFPPLTISTIPTPFASDVCNSVYVAPGGCISCAGIETAGIRDWVACKLEKLAAILNMVKFDFYNDWVSGTLYFPLIKRKYKVKKNKKGRGQIKKDKFCDFDCRPDYQEPQTYKKYRYKIKNNTLFQNETISVNGCSVTFKASYRYVTQWYGTYGQDPVAAQAAANLAARDELVFHGVDSNLNACTLKFSDSAVSQAITNNSNMSVTLQDKTFPGPHGKPKYIKADDPVTGLETWENVGGHGHHQNRCNSVYRVERQEFFRTTLGCDGVVNPAALGTYIANGTDIETTDPELEDGVGSSCVGNNNCSSKCENGVKPCNILCPCGDISGGYNDNNIRHGVIKMENDTIYYASLIKTGDNVFNDKNYKANLLFPTDISEMGSSVTCDIDEVPFIIGELEPTTFEVSEENLSYKIDQSTNPQKIEKVEDKDAELNLRAYVSFGCTFANCVNTMATANQSQIGVEMLDSNDLGMEIGNCQTYFLHDSDVREYFCRRFSTYTDGNLNINYMRPSSNEFDNVYNEYENQTLTSTITFETEDGLIVDNTYNDADEFLTGDRCGLKTDNTPNYFYGIGVGGAQQFFNDFPTNSFIDDLGNNANSYGIKFSTSQTPYYHYFGIVPGNTSLHKLVTNYFADKIDKVTLQGLGENELAAENTYNQPNFRNVEQNKFTILKTCLGQTQVAMATEVDNSGGSTGGGISNFGGGIVAQTVNNIIASNFNPGTGGVAPPPPAYYNPQLDNGTSNGVGLNCSTGLSQKTGTITVTQTPSLVTVEVDGGNTALANNVSGAFGVEIFNPNGFYTPSPPEVTIEDSPNATTQPSAYSNPLNGTINTGDLKYYNIVFNNTGTYDYTLTYNCLNSNQNGYIALRT